MKGVQIGVLVAVIAACGWWLTNYYSTKPDAGEPVTMPTPCVCSACGKSYVTGLGKQPGKCLECGKQELWRAVKCSGCKTIYAFGLGDGAAGTSTKCPKCGKSGRMEIKADELPTKP